MEENQGLTILFDKKWYEKTGDVRIEGTFSTFVNCGSQYAIWYQFPDTIRYNLKDLDTGKVYESVNNELSISWNGNEVYDEYAKKPCDKVIKKDFALALKDIYFIDPPETIIKNFELFAYYLNYTSGTLVFENTPVLLISQ